MVQHRPAKGRSRTGEKTLLAKANVKAHRLPSHRVMSQSAWQQPRFVELNLSAEVGLYYEDQDFGNVPPRHRSGAKPIMAVAPDEPVNGSEGALEKGALENGRDGSLAAGG